MLWLPKCLYLEFGNSDKLITGIRLFEIIQDNFLLINEDVAILRNAFDYQLELQNNDQRKKELNKIYSIPKTISIPTAFLLIGIFIEFQNLSLLSKIIILIVMVSLVIVLFKRNSCKNFNVLFEMLIKQISCEKKSFKKLKELIDDIWNHSNYEDYEKRLKKLKIVFRDVGLKCLLDFRNYTLLIKDKWPLKSDIDDNLISSLPNDLYEAYNDDDLNAKALKSLKQLQRLQISEFFKRILLLFVKNYYQDPLDFDKKFSVNTNIDILKKLIDNSKERQNQITSIISFYKSFYEAKILTCKIKKENECSTLWLACRNLRKTLFRSISIIEQCEVILDQNIDLDSEKKLDFNSKLETLFGDISTASEIVLNLQKTLKHKIIDLPTINDCNDLSTKNIRLNDNNENLQVNQTLLTKDECEQPKDEVFEAFIEDQPKTDSDKNIDFDLDIEMIRDAENVFWELKHALKNKAIENKIREAKALGLEINLDQIENEYKSSLENDHGMNIRTNDTKPKTINYVSEQNQNSPKNFNFEFNFDIAMEAANQMKLCLNIQEDTFSENENESND